MLVFFEYYYLYHLSPYLSLIGFAFETIVHQDKDTYVQAGQYLMHGLGYTFGHRRDDGDTVADHSYGGESNQYLAGIDETQITRLEQPLQEVDALLKHYNVISETDNVKDIIVSTTLDYVGKINISSLFGGVLQGLGSLFLAVFSILFISFFILLDFSKVQNTLVRMVPDQFQHEITNTIHNTKRLLSNYFVGLFIEIVLMGSLEFIILSLLGIENALLISVISGIMIIIPYIGSIISYVIGCFIAITGAYIASRDVNLLEVFLKVSFTSIGCRLIDNFFLQPYIASKSVRAHPLEIFLIVLISGYIAGVPGMMLGIPAYTFIRVFAKEFFGNNNFIKTLTAGMHLPDDYSSSSKS